MNTNTHSLVAASFALVLLTFAVALRMMFSRVREMRHKRIHPQKVAVSAQMAARLEDTRAADNFRNLCEAPVLFYTLVALALAIGHTPTWLTWGGWLFVVLRVLHSVIQCTYNKVMHRFVIFVSGFVLLMGLWAAFFVTLPVTGLPSP
jgi:hypothetical protein